MTHGIAPDQMNSSALNDFADEETDSSYVYLSGYRPRSIAEQAKILHQHFPQLGISWKEVVELPVGAEGWFAIPRWRKLAPSYNDAVELVLRELSKQRNGKFTNYQQGELGPDRLRETIQKTKVFEVIGRHQEGHDLLIIGAQFGFEHRGKSVRRVRVITNCGNQFGLGAFEVGIMLLSHFERLNDFDDLWADCPGDEYCYITEHGFVLAPCFAFNGQNLEFRTGKIADIADWCGSVTGFHTQ